MLVCIFGCGSLGSSQSSSLQFHITTAYCTYIYQVTHCCISSLFTNYVHYSLLYVASMTSLLVHPVSSRHTQLSSQSSRICKHSAWCSSYQSSILAFMYQAQTILLYGTVTPSSLFLLLLNCCFMYQFHFCCTTSMLLLVSNSAVNMASICVCGVGYWLFMIPVCIVESCVEFMRN